MSDNFCYCKVRRGIEKIAILLSQNWENLQVYERKRATTIATGKAVTIERELEERST